MKKVTANKPGKINEGFVARLKSLSVAANVPMENIKQLKLKLAHLVLNVKVYSY